MGRRRVEIKRIEDKSRMQTTFTKRRQGLFKKAKEYAIMSGAEAAIITFSDAGNCFGFGHPSVDAVVQRYLAAVAADSPENVIEKYADVDQFKKLEENPLALWTDDELEKEKEIGENPAAEVRTEKRVEEATEKSRFRALLESEIKDSDLGHLQKLKSELEDLKVTLEKLLP